MRNDRIAHPLFYDTEVTEKILESPRQLNITECHVDLAIQLNKIFHSRLPIVIKNNVVRCKHLICFAAEFNGVYYGSAIWTDPIARMLNLKNWIELRRLALADDVPKNTATMMIAVMVRRIKEKWPWIVHAISYQDTAVHNGTIYKASNWKQEQVNKDGNWIRKNRQCNEAQAPTMKIRWGIDI